jgi:hypothetical protein
MTFSTRARKPGAGSVATSIDMCRVSRHLAPTPPRSDL